MPELPTDVLLFGDSERRPALRHEIPLAIGDPFLYAEAGGRRAAVVSVLERSRVEALGLDLDLLSGEDLGRDELVAQGLTHEEIDRGVALRAVERLGIRAATVPGDFPLALADALRERGVTLVCDDATFALRRRAKTPHELAGIRRAQVAADAGMSAATALLRAADAGATGEPLRLDGEILTAERVRSALRDACAAAGAPAPPDVIVAPGAQAAAGHEPGSGPLPAGVPITIDLWPCDEASGCYADMTRTFVVGEVDARTGEQFALAREALEAVRAAARPGVTGHALWNLACDVFERAGHPTQRTKEPGATLVEGFFFGLGHGVGLEVHEPPSLGRSDTGEELRVGDVIAVEPGTYDSDRGGARLEDLLEITEDGCRTLTDYPYDLAP